MDEPVDLARWRMDRHCDEAAPDLLFKLWVVDSGEGDVDVAAHVLVDPDTRDDVALLGILAQYLRYAAQHLLELANVDDDEEE